MVDLKWKILLKWMIWRFPEIGVPIITHISSSTLVGFSLTNQPAIKGVPPWLWQPHETSRGSATSGRSCRAASTRWKTADSTCDAEPTRYRHFRLWFSNGFPTVFHGLPGFSMLYIYYFCTPSRELEGFSGILQDSYGITPMWVLLLMVSPLFVPEDLLVHRLNSAWRWPRWPVTSRPEIST